MLKYSPKCCTIPLNGVAVFGGSSRISKHNSFFVLWGKYSRTRHETSYPKTPHPSFPPSFPLLLFKTSVSQRHSVTIQTHRGKWCMDISWRGRLGTAGGWGSVLVGFIWRWLRASPAPASLSLHTPPASSRSYPCPSWCRPAQRHPEKPCVYAEGGPLSWSWISAVEMRWKEE